MGDPREGGENLKLTFRRIHSEDSARGRVLGVFCPRRAHVVDVSECRSCEHCRGLCVDPRDRETFLRCTWEDARGEIPVYEAREERSSPPSEPPARHTPLSAVMSSPARCVTPDTSIAELTELFVRAGISAAPVIDAAGKAIGIVSKTDVLALYATEDAARPGQPTEGDALEGGLALALGETPASARLSTTKVREVMTRLVFALGAEASLSRAAALMAYEGVHRIVVAAADGSALGIVSSLDILRWMGQRDGYVLPHLTRPQTDRNPE